jgi:hypothetical protein
MDISGVSAAAARPVSTNTSNADSQQSQKVDTQSGNNITPPSPDQQKADNLRATANQQVPTSNASTESNTPDSSTSKPVVSDNINQALVQQAIAKPDATPQPKGNADLDKKAQDSKDDNRASEARADSAREDSKRADAAQEAAVAEKISEQSADGGSKDRPEF